jgi:hypothetical protein
LTTTALARPLHLQERLCAILKPESMRYRSGLMIAVSVIVMSVVFISMALTQLVTAERQSPTNILSIANDAIPVRQREKLALVGEPMAAVPALPAATSREDDALHPTISPAPTVEPVDRPTYLPIATQDTEDNQTGDQDFDDFSVEERTRLLGNGIGPAYMKEMRDAGYAGLSVAQLIALFSNGVHADYVAGLRSVGYSGLSISDLLSLKTNGVTPEVIRSFQAATRANLEAKKYALMLSNGVTPLYVRSLSDAGYDYLNANEVTAMRLAGVTSEFIRDANSRGNTNLSPNRLIELKRRERP